MENYIHTNTHTKIYKNRTNKNVWQAIATAYIYIYIYI